MVPFDTQNPIPLIDSGEKAQPGNAKGKAPPKSASG